MIASILERFGVGRRNAAAGGPRGGVSSFPNVSLKTHRNEAVRFYDDVLQGKVVVISFMYTRCTSTCPPTISSLRRLQRALGGRAGRDVFLYSITLDPAYDTPDVLNGYARTVEAGHCATEPVRTITDEVAPLLAADVNKWDLIETRRL